MSKLKKILLVDDSKPFNYLSRIALRNKNVNCIVEEALNGQIALDFITKDEVCPDIILLDINMPVMDGFQFLKEYEKRGRCCDNTKIFMLTSSVREEDKTKSFSSKFVKGYFDKPLTDQQVDEILAE
jgi:CheY-like chemotaxis protein